MKVAVVTGSFVWDAIGGAEYQCWLIANGLVSMGHEVTYVALDSNEDSEVMSAGVRVRRVVKPSGGAGPLGQDFLFRALAGPFDIVYLRWFAQLPTAVAVCREMNIPLVFGISAMSQCTPWQLNGYHNGYHLSKVLDHWRCYQSLKAVRLIVFQTAAQAGTYRRRNSDVDYEVIPNGHPLPLCSAPLDEREPIVMWVNNIKRVKRPGLFLDLARSLATRDVDFVMIGRNPPAGWYARSWDRILSRAPARLNYLGPLPIETVNDLLSKAMVFVNTSKPAEGFPNSFIQAWMRGVPTVSLDCDPDDIMERRKVGFHSRSLDRMVADVEAILDNHELRIEMGRRAQAYANEFHTEERLAIAYDRLFRRVVAAGAESMSAR